MPGSRAFVFLDRDGTLVRDVGYPHRVEDYELLPGVIPALVRLRDAGFALAIVTNQSGLARGLFSRAEYDRFHGYLLDELASAGIEITATLMCPHGPDDGCACRKPAPGLLLEARARLGADLARSWVVGDKGSDVLLAANAGCRGILLLTSSDDATRTDPADSEQKPPREAAPCEVVVRDLGGAASHILAHRGLPSDDRR